MPTRHYRSMPSLLPLGQSAGRGSGRRAEFKRALNMVSLAKQILCRNNELHRDKSMHDPLHPQFSLAPRLLTLERSFCHGVT